LKQGDTILPLCFDFPLEYAVRRIQNNQKNINTINTVKKNTETLLEASREFGLEVNTEKTL
jgi:hypothetical protein